jgi:single-strand DNA-binding protein
MANGLNKVQLIGNLGRDAELKFAPGGDAVVTISVATTEHWKDRATGDAKERTEWHRVVIWGKTAENLAEYLTKGKQVYVEGRIQTRVWTDKDGVERKTVEIRSDRIILLGGKNGGAKPKAATPATTNEAEPAGEGDDSEIPF